MSNKSFKPILKYLLQLLLLTVPVVTIVNIILLVIYENQSPLFPFASVVSMLITYINLWTNGLSSPSIFGPELDYIAFIVGVIPCIIICILYFVAFLGVKNKKNRVLTYLQYYVIVEVVLLSSKPLYTFIYVTLFLLLLFRKEYLTANEAN